MAIEKEKREVEEAIERARDGVSDRIDELDRRLRTTFDISAWTREHSTELVAGGAVLGFLAGFGFPKVLRRAVSIGIPLTLFAMRIKKAWVGGGDGSAPDYEI